MDFVIKATYSKTREGTASIPESWWADGQHAKATYVRLKVGRQAECMSVAKREGAGGNEVWVVPGVFELDENDTATVEVEEISQRMYRTCRLLQTAKGRWAVGGLIVALIGLSIPLAFGFGEAVHALVTVPTEWKAILLWVSPLLELVGVVIVFVRGVWLGDE